MAIINWPHICSSTRKDVCDSCGVELPTFGLLQICAGGVFTSADYYRIPVDSFADHFKEFASVYSYEPKKRKKE